MRKSFFFLAIFLFLFNSAISQNLKKDSTKFKRWEFGIGIGAILCPNIINDKSIDIEYNSKPLLTPELNFYVYYNFNKNWAVQTGLSLATLKYNFHFNSSLYKGIDSSTQQSIFIPFTSNILMRYYRVCLPLYAYYILPNLISKKIDFYIKLGGTLNFTQKYNERVIIIENNQTNIYNSNPVLEKRNLNPFHGYSDHPYNWAISLFVGNKLQLKNKIFLYYELGGSYGIRSLVCDTFFWHLYVKSTGVCFSINTHICF